jgi:hypothetical protein
MLSIVTRVKRELSQTVDTWDSRLHRELHTMQIWAYYRKFATEVVNSRVDFNAMYFLHTNHSGFLYYTILYIFLCRENPQN